ncbi:MAG: hypothetical protein JWN04_3781 [Myxococcaceae bacterium]|nr:hypothetical protein [Myxococcaceae bacterium]
MSKSRDNKHRRNRATYKLAEWRAKNSPERETAVPVQIVGVIGTLPIASPKK